jgi:hypothetical protein
MGNGASRFLEIHCTTTEGGSGGRRVIVREVIGVGSV